MSAPAKSDGSAVASAEKSAVDNNAAQQLSKVVTETAPSIGGDPDTYTVWQTIKDNPVILLCCFYANIGAFMYGFDNITLSLCLDMPAFV